MRSDRNTVVGGWSPVSPAIVGLPDTPSRRADIDTVDISRVDCDGRNLSGNALPALMIGMGPISLHWVADGAGPAEGACAIAEAG